MEDICKRRRTDRVKLLSEISYDEGSIRLGCQEQD